MDFLIWVQESNTVQLNLALSVLSQRVSDSQSEAPLPHTSLQILPPKAKVEFQLVTFHIILMENLYLLLNFEDNSTLEVFI